MQTIDRTKRYPSLSHTYPNFLPAYFNEAITLWVIARSVDHSGPYQLAYFLYQHWQEVLSPVRRETFSNSMSHCDLIHAEVCDRFCRLIGHCKGSCYLVKSKRWHTDCLDATGVVTRCWHQPSRRVHPHVWIAVEVVHRYLSLFTMHAQGNCNRSGTCQPSFVVTSIGH